MNLIRNLKKNNEMGMKGGNLPSTLGSFYDISITKYLVFYVSYKLYVL